FWEKALKKLPTLVLRQERAKSDVVRAPIDGVAYQNAHDGFRMLECEEISVETVVAPFRLSRARLQERRFGQVLFEHGRKLGPNEGRHLGIAASLHDDAVVSESGRQMHGPVQTPHRLEETRSRSYVLSRANAPPRSIVPLMDARRHRD